MMITTVRGSMKIRDFDLSFDPENLEGSSVRVSLDAASIETGQEARDQHLVSDDFLKTDAHPTIDFASKKIVADGDGYSATTKINREDFGLTWNVALEQGGLLVSKDIKVEINLAAVSSETEAAAQVEAEKELEAVSA
jgi:polyisoprenoid-binding protein YceI